MARGGNPPPGLQWYVGGERWEGTTEAINQETGVTVSIVSFPVDQADHKKEIRCEVVHEALTNILEVATNLDVQCKYSHYHLSPQTQILSDDSYRQYFLFRYNP